MFQDPISGGSGSTPSCGKTREHSMQSTAERSSHFLNSRLIPKRLNEASIETTSHHDCLFVKLPTVASAKTTGKDVEVDKVSTTVESPVLPGIHRNENNASGSGRGGFVERETRRRSVSFDVSHVEKALNREDTHAWNEIEEHVRKNVRRNNWKEAMADLEQLFTDEELAMVRQSQQTDCLR